jgi:hypothetical protein
MKFVCYRQWRQLPADIDDLFEQGAKKSLFISQHWLETLYFNAFDNQNLLLASVVDEGRVLALLPLIAHENGHWQSLSHRYTSFYSPLLATECRTDALACLAEGLSQLAFRSLRLEPVAEDDSNTQRLKQAMETAGFEHQRHFRFYNWIHPTGGQSFDAYMQGRPTQLRNTIARKQRKLERDHGYTIKMFRGKEVKAALSDYHSAYSASWKAYEQYAELLNALATNLSAPDWTRLAVLYIDEKPAAAQLWFVLHGKASIFRLAYDEDWKQYSPGSILTAYLMQYVIDTDEVDEIDFLNGNEAYKQDWMTERRERWGLVFFKPPEAKTGLNKLMNKLKSWKKHPAG